MFLRVVDVMVDLQLSGGTPHLRCKQVAALMSTCSRMRTCLVPLAKMVSVNETSDALAKGMRKARAGSGIHHKPHSFICFGTDTDFTRLHFIVSRNVDRQILTVYCTAFRRPTVTEISVSVFRDPKKTAKQFMAVSELYIALYKRVHLSLRNSDVVVRSDQDSFICMQREVDHTRIDFIISRYVVRGIVTIYCAKPKHPYFSVVQPTTSIRGTRFSGWLTYTNHATRRVVETAYCIRNVWHLHGLPRSIEGGFLRVYPRGVI